MRLSIVTCHQYVSIAMVTMKPDDNFRLVTSSKSPDDNCNCGGEHPANYRGYKNRKEASATKRRRDSNQGTSGLKTTSNVPKKTNTQYLKYLKILKKRNIPASGLNKGCFASVVNCTKLTMEIPSPLSAHQASYENLFHHCPVQTNYFDCIQPPTSDAF